MSGVQCKRKSLFDGKTLAIYVFLEGVAGFLGEVFFGKDLPYDSFGGVSF